MPGERDESNKLLVLFLDKLYLHDDGMKQNIE